MAETVILHVGPHKTGTTALQKAFRAGEDLLARHGVLYPQTGRAGDSHAVLGEALLRGDTSYLTDLARESQDWRVVLISCEHLSALAPEGLAALRDSFPGAGFRVAYALRRLTRLWPAHWAELVKHGQDLSFSGYLERVLRQDDRAFFAPVLPLRQLGRLTDAFGAQALHLSVHDQFRTENQDLGPAFIDDLLGLGQIAPAFATRWSNPTPGEVETALVCLLNRHLGTRVDHLTRGAARQALLGSLAGGPDWLAAFRAMVTEGPRIALGSDHPLVAETEAEVVARFGLLVPDGLPHYLAPDRSSLPDVDALVPGPDLRTDLADAFEAALAAVGSGAPR